MAIRPSRGGIVAEKSTVWRGSGAASRIASMSSAKPMSSISSASSSTTVIDAAEPQRAAPDVVERAARRRHDDVDAALERAQLRADRLAAVDRQDAHAEPAPVLVDRLGDLHRQLARRHEHERGGVAHRCARRSSRWRIGSANAAVLPVPVAACPSRSRPSSSGGIASRWIGVGSS